MHEQKLIFVTGGVCSSLGKGIAAASIAKILRSSGYRVSIMKLDPYLNVDPGTMSPYQHGEVFVTDDGAETDLDLGHYERFIDVPLTQHNTVTTGKIYQQVLNAEREGKYLGGTIQIVPHIVDQIQKDIHEAAQATDSQILVCEIGGTVGDIEGEPYLEAIRQMQLKMGQANVLNVHLTLLPYLAASKELKTKPTQLSVREIRRSGIQPDIIITRADVDIPEEILQKVADFCNTAPDAVFPALTVESIYEVPLLYAQGSMPAVLARELQLPQVSPQLAEWEQVVTRMKHSHQTLRIGLAGKYNGLEDAYISVIEALKSACYAVERKLELQWIDTEEIEKGSKSEWERVRSCAGIVVPGGFGNRGVEGKIQIARYCRENEVPYLGLCLGSQIMAIEYARHVADMPQATSQEWSESGDHIVHYLPGQHDEIDKGGSMRLGAYDCVIQEGTLAHRLYDTTQISERHRHRYEFHNAHRDRLTEAGFCVSGTSPDGSLVEIVEIPHHPYMIGSQFHPEFLSRPQRPHPLFQGLIDASIRQSR